MPAHLPAQCLQKLKFERGTLLEQQRPHHVLYNLGPDGGAAALFSGRRKAGTSRLARCAPARTARSASVPAIVPSVASSWLLLHGPVACDRTRRPGRRVAAARPSGRSRRHHGPVAPGPTHPEVRARSWCWSDCTVSGCPASYHHRCSGQNSAPHGRGRCRLRPSQAQPVLWGGLRLSTGSRAEPPLPNILATRQSVLDRVRINMFERVLVGSVRKAQRARSFIDFGAGQPHRHDVIWSDAPVCRSAGLSPLQREGSLAGRGPTHTAHPGANRHKSPSQTP